ncbi:MutS-related protein [Membranihabitans marinus]|uniref:MutS-related protein n=1 Tax=Membranihabitans marinus TaxID=1227546 RepID=UPI001F3B1B39|nr:hypothetical protein [Membranihabitans marinus]
MNPIEIYGERINNLSQTIAIAQRKVNLFSWARFIVFLLAVFAFYYASKPDNNSLLYVIIGLALVAGFLYIVKIHANAQYDIKILKNKKEINAEEIESIHRRPTTYFDGHIYHQEGSYSNDLDIFGPLSLYHIINRCFTKTGQEYLSNQFLNQPLDDNTAMQRQESIAESIQWLDVRQSFLAHGLEIQNDDSIKAEFQPEKALMSISQSKKIKYLRWLPIVITLITILFYTVNGNNNILLYGFIFNIVIAGLFLKNTQAIIFRCNAELKGLKLLIPAVQSILSQKPNSTELQQLLQSCSSGMMATQELDKSLNLLDSRNNVIVGLLLNGIFGFDLWMTYKIHDWHRKNKTNIPDWKDAIGRFETIFSLANFAYNNPSYTFPNIQSKGQEIKGHNIRHPFIPDDKNTGNSFEIGLPFKVMLVTGSNMSGKSTFLRAIGVNQILASCGSVVAADEFHTSILPIYSSFRKSDSLQENTSLFFDEIKRLKMIVEAVDKVQSKPALVLLDEILRGTNSEDKYYGSKQYILKLLEKNAYTLLATHDLELSKLEASHSPGIQNYSFESTIQKDELFFDYKIKKGVAVHKNATFLMEKMGII